MAVEVKKIDTLNIADDTYVKLSEMGNITEIQHNTHRNKRCNIQRIDKDHLLVFSTGEVREVVHYAERIDDMKSVSQSLKKLRELINANVVNTDNVIWFTLTYRDNMTDPKKLYTDFKKFNMRLKTWEDNNSISHHEYIICAEPQGRGAWHIHGLLIWEQKAPFIPHDTFWRIWSKEGFNQRAIDGVGYDFVNIKSLNNCDNVGSYLTAYLGDMSLDEYKKAKPNARWCGEVKDCNVRENGKKVVKKILKGARLHFYPAGFRIFRCSRGVKRPKVSLITLKKAKEKVRTAILTFRKSVSIKDDNGYETTITTFYYNTALYKKYKKRINSIIIFFKLLSSKYPNLDLGGVDSDGHGIKITT